LAISHKDTDHVGGALSLMRTIEFKDLIGTLPAYHFLVREAKALGIPALPCQALQEWQWDGVHFKVWHPDSGTTFDPIYHQGKPNASSCVIEVHNARHSVWLTGDVEIGGEALIANNYERNEQQQLILLVPHHGSATSSSEIFLDTLRPNWAVVQAGYKNRYKHPVGRVVERYDARKIPLLQTVQTGAQIWESRAGQMSYRFWREVQKRFWHYRESPVQK
jgi:competence protein ComEC